jgi:hypothetical protein
LLQINNFEVKEMRIPSDVEGEEPKYILGVTDLIFNPVFAIYECLLKNRDGKWVTPGYWKKGYDD